MIVLNILVGFWLAIVGPGLLYSIRLVKRARSSLAWLRANNLNSYREVVAVGAIQRGHIRVFIFGCMALMGVDAAAVQFFPVGSDVRQVLSAVFRLLFILMALAFSYKTYLEQHELDLLINEDQRRLLRTRSTDSPDDTVLEHRMKTVGDRRD